MGWMGTRSALEAASDPLRTRSFCYTVAQISVVVQGAFDRYLIEPQDNNFARMPLQQ
jgi:hypothetical protein